MAESVVSNRFYDHIGLDGRTAFSHKIFAQGTSIADMSMDCDHILFLLSGSLTVSLDGGAAVTCQAKQLILLPDGVKSNLTAEQNCTMVLLKSYGLYFCGGKLINIDYKEVVSSTDVSSCSIELREPLDGLLRSIRYYMDNNLYGDTLHCSKLQELSILLLSLYTMDEICRFFYPLLIKNKFDFCSKVLVNHSKAKNVKELAQMCGCGLSNFNKQFSKHFGQPPYQWMRQQKVPDIERLLMDSSLPIKSIVAEFGFSDQSSFNVFCRQYMGATPLQVRKRDKFSKKG